MQLKAAARQGLERRPITPIEREKATGLARGRASEAGAFDDDRLDAATAQEIGGGGADDTATTDDNLHGCLRARLFTRAIGRWRKECGHAFGDLDGSCYGGSGMSASTAEPAPSIPRVGL